MILQRLAAITPTLPDFPDFLRAQPSRIRLRGGHLSPTLHSFKPHNQDLNCGHSFVEMADDQNYELQLLIFPTPHNKELVNYFFRLFFRLVALVWLALGMSAPVSAWTVHQSAHAVAKVSLDVPHHHETDGSVAVHDTGESDSRDSGPDHMPSILLGAVALAVADIEITTPIVERAAFIIPLSRSAKQHASDGLRRPPRLG